MNPSILVVGPSIPHHVNRIAKILGAHTLPILRDYDLIIQMGCYARHPYLQDQRYTESINCRVRALLWCGTDILMTKEFAPSVNKHLRRHWDVHLAECPPAKEEIDALFDLDCKVFPLPPWHSFEPMPLPKEFTVGVYMPLTRTDFYNLELCQEVQAKGKFRFIYYGLQAAVPQGMEVPSWYTVEPDMADLMKITSANLRIVSHDTWPFSPMEYMAAGRRVATNVDMPYGFGCWTADEAIEILKYIEQFKEPDLEASQFWRDWGDHGQFQARAKALAEGDYAYQPPGSILAAGRQVG